MLGDGRIVEGRRVLGIVTRRKPIAIHDIFHADDSTLGTLLRHLIRHGSWIVIFIFSGCRLDRKDFVIAGKIIPDVAKRLMREYDML